MIETGKIIGIDGNLAKVLVLRHTACGDCGACQVGKDNLNMILTAENSIEAELGDNVQIELNTENFLFASFILYGIPLLALILGISSGYYLFKNLRYEDGIAQLVAFASGIVLLAVSYLIIKNNESKIGKMKRFKPRLIRVINTNND